jgi:hypothetical protein
VTFPTPVDRLQQLVISNLTYNITVLYGVRDKIIDMHLSQSLTEVKKEATKEFTALRPQTDCVLAKIDLPPVTSARNSQNYHQPINDPTAGTQAFLLDYP